MRIDEYVVLEALNIASTQYKTAVGGFRATAQQIAEVLNTDDRFDAERVAVGGLVNAAWVGARLRGLHDWEGQRREALVERASSRHWRLTDAALKVLIA